MTGRLRTLARIGVALLVVAGAASVVRLRWPLPGPTAAARPAPPAPTFTVTGLAFRPDSVPLGPYAVVRVRLVDLTSDDTTGAVLATSARSLPGAGRVIPWSVAVPPSPPRAESALFLIIAITDGSRVRYLGSGAASAFAPERTRPAAGPVSPLFTAPDPALVPAPIAVSLARVEDG